jgi:hypothetical protein
MEKDLCVSALYRIAHKFSGSLVEYSENKSCVRYIFPSHGLADRFCNALQRKEIGSVILNPAPKTIQVVF